MDVNTLTIGEAKELVKMFGGVTQQATTTHTQYLGIRIVILQRGWVAVGVYKQAGDYVTIEKAAIIRKWGTTKGLPELATRGPLADTVLDKGPNMRFHILTEIASIECVAEAWQGKL